MVNIVRSRKALGALLIASALALPGIHLDQPSAPATAHAAGSTAAQHVALAKPIITPPARCFFCVNAPAPYPLQASASSVTVSWYDRSTNAQGFQVFRRDTSGNWQMVYQVPTRATSGTGSGNRDYSWVDTSTDLSGQCYRIAAYNSARIAYTDEECTVRPDPNRFPQVVPSTATQWLGLSDTNDGTGRLENTDMDKDLLWSHQTWGVDLDWSLQHSLWRVEAQGGPHLMKGQAVAIRVWGGGWLKYGDQTWGVDLQLSDTPVYEWYVIGVQSDASGGTSAGLALTATSKPFALWNSSAQTYLVYSNQTFGVDLDWYRVSRPAPSPTPAPTLHGVKTERVLNCSVEQHPVEVFIADQTAGGQFVDLGRLAAQYGPDGCPAAGSVPITFSLESGHHYLLVATDRLFSTCDGNDDPQDGGCIKMEAQFVGDASGFTRTDIVDDGVVITP